MIRLCSGTIRFLAVFMLLIGINTSAVCLSPMQSLREGDGRALFGFSCSFGKDKDITGIMVLKLEGDTLRGTVLNEFGVRAFDVESLPGHKKLKVSNVIKPLNKWYIRRSLSRDIFHLLGSDSLSYSSKRVSYSLSYLNDK